MKVSKIVKVLGLVALGLQVGCSSTPGVTKFRKDYGDKWIYPTDSVILNCEYINYSRYATVTVDGVTYALSSAARNSEKLPDVFTITGKVGKFGDHLISEALEICETK